MFRGFLHAIVLAAATCLGVGVAEAGSGYATGGFTLRTGPGATYSELVRVPPRAKLGVYRCAAWCEITYGNYRGYAQARFVTVGRKPFADSLLITPVTPGARSFVPIYVSPQTAYITGTVGPKCRRRPADMRVWYYDGRWTNRPDYFMMVKR
ncbi:MAG TPA: hypothetical protein VFB16_12335 [Bauldia sp.]|nr:hypothetical protein [Bauldia sp.]